MLSAIFNVLPDWAVAAILAALAWFGVNYIWLGPAYFERVATVRSCQDRDFHRGDVRWDAAMYTATLSIMGSENTILNQVCRGRR